MGNERQKKVIKKHKSNSKWIKIISFVYKFILVAIIIGASILAITVFFEIKTIDVKGLTRYEHDEIITTSNVSIGDNLFFILDFSIKEKITSTYPYVDKIEIQRKLPDGIEFIVTECVPIAVIRSGFDYYLIDSKGKVLEEILEEETKGYILVNGISIPSIEIGENVSSKELDEIDTLLSIMSEFSNRDLLHEIQYIDVSKLFDIKIGYKDTFVIELGSMEEFDRKIRFLLAVEEQLYEEDSGIIDLTNVDVARFKPYND